MAASPGDVRNAVAAVLRANLPTYEIARYAPDTPGPKTAWVWIEAVDYRDGDAVGGGYSIDATVHVQLPRNDPREAQARADELMNQDDGVPSWFDADPELGGVVRLAVVNRATLGFLAPDDTTFAVASFAVTIYT